jgi:hypothetical protein
MEGGKLFWRLELPIRVEMHAIGQVCMTEHVATDTYILNHLRVCVSSVSDFVNGRATEK